MSVDSLVWPILIAWVLWMVGWGMNQLGFFKKKNGRPTSRRPPS